MPSELADGAGAVRRVPRLPLVYDVVTHAQGPGIGMQLYVNVNMFFFSLCTTVYDAFSACNMYIQFRTLAIC